MVKIKRGRDFSEWKRTVTDIIMGNPDDLQDMHESNQLNKIVKFNGKCFKSRFKVPNAGESQSKGRFQNVLS